MALFLLRSRRYFRQTRCYATLPNCIQSCRLLPSRRLASSCATITPEHRRQLADDGVTVIRDVVPPDLLQELRAASDSLCSDPALSHLREDAFTGSLIPVVRHNAFARLVALPAAMDCFSQLGWGTGTSKGGGDGLAWMSGFLISKPPFSPSLGWHQDGWFWDEAVAYEEAPAQVFAMYYLTDTTAANGCLRVLPGTHHAPGHTLHAALGRAHSEEVRSESDASNEGEDDDWAHAPEHSEQEGAVDIPVNAGDLVLGDARVLHGARRNTTDEERALVTLWYIPRLHELPARMQRHISMLHEHQCGAAREVWLGSEFGREDEATAAVLKTLLPPVSSRGAGGDGRGDGDDEYDHNLNFMERTPGFVASASAEARAAYDQWRTAYYRSRES